MKHFCFIAGKMSSHNSLLGNACKRKDTELSVSCDLFCGFVNNRDYKLMNTVLRKNRNPNCSQALKLPKILWVVLYRLKVFLVYTNMYLLYVCLYICKHTDEHTYICSNQWADPKNGINNNSTLLDMDYWNFYGPILTTQLKNAERLHANLRNAIYYNHNTSSYMTLQCTVGCWKVGGHFEKWMSRKYWLNEDVLCFQISIYT